jgi:hypothetical protein
MTAENSHQGNFRNSEYLWGHMKLSSLASTDNLNFLSILNLRRKPIRLVLNQENDMLFPKTNITTCKH